MSSQEDPNKLIDELILDGSLEVAAVNEKGEFLYHFTDKLESNRPDIHKEFMEMMWLGVRHLWTKGFVDMDITQEEPLVKLTELAFDDKARNSLQKEELDFLDIVIKAYSES